MFSNIYWPAVAVYAAVALAGAWFSASRCWDLAARAAIHRLGQHSAGDVYPQQPDRPAAGPAGWSFLYLRAQQAARVQVSNR